jgi:hypothetical protein
MSPKYKGMVVGWCYGTPTCSPDMCKNNICSRVRANAPKVEVAEWRANGLVECRPQSSTVLDEIILRLGVPCDSEPINVEELVARCDFLLSCDILRVVVQELGEVVIVDLVGEAVFRSNEHVFEKAFFVLGYVDEPAGVVSGGFAVGRTKRTYRHILRNLIEWKLRIELTVKARNLEE